MTRYLALLAGLVAATVGCSNAPPTGTVVGTVTYDGKPLADTPVYFVGATGGESIGATTDADGKYKALNVPAGEVLVSVRGSYTPSDSAEVIKKMGQGENKKGIAAPPLPKSNKPGIPARYGEPSTSNLKTTVKPDAQGETTYDISLTK